MSWKIETNKEKGGPLTDTGLRFEWKAEAQAYAYEGLPRRCFHYYGFTLSESPEPATHAWIGDGELVAIKKESGQ